MLVCGRNQQLSTTDVLLALFPTEKWIIFRKTKLLGHQIQSPATAANSYIFLFIYALSLISTLQLNSAAPYSSMALVSEAIFIESYNSLGWKEH